MKKPLTDERLKKIDEEYLGCFPQTERLHVYVGELLAALKAARQEIADLTEEMGDISYELREANNRD